MKQVTPYDRLAVLYDRLVGDSQFPIIIHAFEEAVRQHNIRFRTVADIGCGTGTFLSFVASPGRKLVGVDRSPAMLREARSKLQGNDATLSCQDMRQLKLSAPVDLLTCNFDTLNYLLNPRDFLLSLKKFRRYIVSQGHLIFDILTGDDFPARREVGHDVIAIPGGAAVFSTILDGKTKQSLVRIALKREGGDSSTIESHRQRWYPTAWVLDRLRALGFSVRSYNLSRLSESTSSGPGFWVQFVARKMA